MHRSGQDLFLPHARFKTKGESKWRSCCALYSSDLYVEKSKWIYMLSGETFDPRCLLMKYMTLLYMEYFEHIHL
ncbi:hypothetical protein CON64_07945 [Bacillus pseudomycoides]|nr:hypothetical protein CON64_07945 [Bacillus pseudomycoides]